jgi:hypothetical protein
MGLVHEEEEKPCSWTGLENLPQEQEIGIVHSTIVSKEIIKRFDRFLSASALYFVVSLSLVLLNHKLSYYLFSLVPVTESVNLVMMQYAAIFGACLGLCGFLSGKITQWIAPKNAFRGVLLGGFVLYLYIFQEYLQGRFVELLFKKTMDPLNQAVTVGLALLYLLPVIAALGTVRKRRS